MATIKGSKGGSSNPSTPKEADDSLHSVATAKILLALGEGECVNEISDKDIYLDGTPIRSQDGTLNFEGVTWEYRPGTQAQEYIAGLPSVENEIGVSTELKYGTAWTRAISNTSLSAVRLRFGVPALLEQKENGDTVGYRVEYRIELSTDGGAYQTVLTGAFDGKTTTLYERSHRIELPEARTGWQIRVTRLTENSTTARIQSTTNIEAIIEVIDAKLRYPNTELLFITFNAKLFQNIPTISVLKKARIIRIPSNYEPNTREYVGTWDGSFKWGYSNNPAWVFYDVLLNPRFAFGDRLDASQVDKWELYRIAQYCDQQVPDGYGGTGTEPRFLCDVNIQEQAEAFTLLRDLAAIFRGMTYWANNQAVALSDMPRDMSYVYTRANVIDGKFSYTSGSEKDRYSTALVSFSNPENHYNDEPEPVYEPELVKRYGVRQLSITAIGCTRRTEANRRGRWALLTNAKDRTVTFSTGYEGMIPLPGYIIGVADPLLAGRTIGGRVSAVNGRVITLDREGSVAAGDRLVVNLPTGVSEGRTVASVNGAVITLATEFTTEPETGAVWSVDAVDVAIQQYRVTRIADNGNGTFSITAVFHSPEKYDAIDTGARIDERPISALPTGTQKAPESVNVTSYSYVEQGLSVQNMRATWTPAAGAVAYDCEWRRDSNDWVSAPRTGSASFEVPGIYSGLYTVRVRAVSVDGVASQWTVSDAVRLTGKIGEPAAPVNFRTSPIVWGVQLDWDFPASSEDTLHTEIQYTPNGTGEGAQLLTSAAYPVRTYQQLGLQPTAAFYYRARLVDRLGNFSPWTEWVRGEPNTNAADYLVDLDNQIKGTDTWAELEKGVSDLADDVASAQDAIDAANSAAAENAQAIADQAKTITDQANAIAGNTSAIAGNANAIEQETAARIAADTAEAVARAEAVAGEASQRATEIEAAAKKAADELLVETKAREADIATTNLTIQNVNDSLAQQISQVAAGTGEQFDSLKIWYFDVDNEGWTEDDNGSTPMQVTDDGWLKSSNSTNSCRSPNWISINAFSYRFLKLRIKKVGSPRWAGKLWWIGEEETGWNDGRAMALDEPEYNAQNVATLTVSDIEWRNSEAVRRFRLDFATGADADNYFLIDWIAVGRPTPGASTAALQDEVIARTSADSAEATARQTLAAQVRGGYEGSDAAQVSSGLIYSERQLRITAEKAIASDVTALETEFNDNKAAVTQQLGTLTAENQAQAQTLTQLQSGLTDANGKIGANATAITQLETDVSAIDGRVTANSQVITGLQSDLNNMRVGGTNLIPNSGTLTGVSSVVQGETYKGNAIRRIAIAAASTGQYDQFEYELAAPIDGTEVVISFYAKAGNADSSQLYVYLYNPNATLTAASSQGKTGSWSTGGDGAMTLDLTTDWQRYWVKYTRKSGQTGSSRVIFGRLLKGSKDKEAFISSPKFEYGTMPTEWSEAPADNASATALSTLTTRVTAAEGSISTNGQAITQLKGDVSTLNGQMANKADASALQLLQTTVTQQGQDLTSQGSAITDLQNSAQNGKVNYWLIKAFDIKVSSSGYIPALTDLVGVPPLAISELADAAKLDFLQYGDYKIVYAKALVYLAADKTIELSPGARIVDDTGRLYINGVEVATFGASTVKYSLALEKGWNTVEFVVAQITGQFYINFGLKLSDNVDQLFSGAGQLAAASASQVIASQVEKTADKVDANSSAITTLSNSVEEVNTSLNSKADASALNALTTRVTSAEGKITSQGDAITQLTSDLATANGKITANSTALGNLTTRVTAAEGKIDSQAQSITSINSSIKGITAQAANLIPNPTFDPNYGQMGMTVVSSTSEGVPEGCPYDWVVKCALRDHLPSIDNIPCHEGQVFEMSVLAACGTGSAPFQHYIGTASQVSSSLGSPQANGGQISAATGAQWTRTTWRWKVNAAQAERGFFRPFLQISQSGPDFGTVWYATDWQVRDVTAAATAQDTANANATALNLLTTRVTAAEGSLTSQGTAITQLTNSLNATDVSIDAQGKIPGNLLANCSFERGTVNFTGWSSTATIITATQPHSGSKILQLSAGQSNLVGQQVEVTQGRRYRFGVFAKQASGTVINDPGNTKFRIADSTGLLVGVNYGPFTSDWQHVSMEWTATKTTTASFQLTSWLSAGAMYFDDVYVIDITDATKIQANADAITSLNTKVTQQGNDITSQGSAITQLDNSLTTVRYSNSNPWVDGTFESYAVDQAIGGSRGLVTDAYAFSGTKSLLCVRGDGETGNSDKTFGYETAIRESAVYRFECWAMMPADETPPDGWGCYVGLMVRTSEGTAAWPTVFNINEARLAAGGGRGKWVKFTGKIGAGGAQKTRGRLWISTRGTAGAQGYKIYIDDLVITDVTDAHEAQTTADANASAITGLTTRVTSAEGKISSQADALTKLTSDVSTINGTLSQKADASAVTSLQTRVTAAEGKIESQGAAITKLDNSIDAARNTGDNLVQNYDFAQGETAYNTQRSSGSTVTFGDYGDSTAGVRLVRGDGTSPGLFANNKKPIPINGRRRYRYLVKAKGVSGAMNLLLRRWNFNGKTEGSYADKNLTLTTSWQVYTWETDLNQASGVDGAAFGLYCHPANAEIHIDSFTVYDITDEVTISANASALTSLTTKVEEVEGKVTAQASQISSISSKADDAVAAVDSLNETVAASGLSMANGFQQLRTQIGDNSAAVTRIDKVVTDLESSTAEQISQVNATVGGMAATVQESASAVADLNGKLSAQWGVKVQTDNNGVSSVAGIQLGINASGSSEFLVNADTFGVYNNAASGGKVLAFAVSGATAYLRSAMIQDATITNAKIANGAITNAKISGVISSDNWDGGGNGWAIDKSGGAVFNGVTVRGHVEAWSGTFNNVTIADNCNVYGTVYAERISGDVVKCYTVTNGQTITVTPMPFARSLVLPYVGLHIAPFNGSQTYTATVTVRVVINGSATNVNDTVSSAANQRASGGVSAVWNLPANATATVEYSFGQTGTTGRAPSAIGVLVTKD